MELELVTHIGTSAPSHRIQCIATLQNIAMQLVINGTMVSSNVIGLACAKCPGSIHSLNSLENRDQISYWPSAVEKSCTGRFINWSSFICTPIFLVVLDASICWAVKTTVNTVTEPRRVVYIIVFLVLLPASDFFTDILYLITSPFVNLAMMNWTILFIFLPFGLFYYELFVMKDCRFKWRILQPHPALVDMLFESPNLEHIPSIEKLLFMISESWCSSPLFRIL